jgi:hypothetical protein
MKSTTLWVVTPCSLVEVRRHFGGTYRLLLQSLLAVSLLLLALIFDPEDGGDMSLRNVELLPN